MPGSIPGVCIYNEVSHGTIHKSFFLFLLPWRFKKLFFLVPRHVNSSIVLVARANIFGTVYMWFLKRSVRGLVRYFFCFAGRDPGESG